MTPRPPAPLAVRAAMRLLHTWLGGTVKFTTWVLVHQDNPTQVWIAFARDANGEMYYCMSKSYSAWSKMSLSMCRKVWKAWIDSGAVQAEV